MENRLLCHIKMSWTNREDVINIRIERGPKPRLKTLADGAVKVIVPVDTVVNWPAVKMEVSGGYVVTVQRLQQQYKITVQHLHERKPEIVIYSSSFAHDNDIKTQVKEMNTQISEVTIAGPNLDLHGNLRACGLTLESTVGTMHVYSRIQADRLSLHAQSIVIATESLISTSQFRTICRKMQLDGKIFPSEEVKDQSVSMETNLVHLGVDGCIGESNEKENGRMAGKTVQVTADTLSLHISGSLANYGRIVARDRLDLQLGGSFLSLSDGSLDSAGRGYSALKQIRGVRRAPDCAPSSSSLQQAICQQDASAAAALIENGVDLRDKVRSNRLSLKQAAIRKYREKKDESKQNKVRESITLINALFTVHDWRRGTVSANIICASVSKNCEDCAQFTAKELQIKMGGNGKVESDSIWHGTWVEVEAAGNFTFSGQVKHRSLVLYCGGLVKTTEDAIISQEIFARINCKNLESDGIWTVGENLAVDVVENARFLANSYVESEKVEVACGGECSIDGSWQIGGCWLSIGKDLTISTGGKIFVEDGATIGAARLLCYGFCNVMDHCEVQIKKSAHFFSNSKLECHSLKLICEEHCTMGGVCIVDSLNLYVRQDLISTSTGKTVIFNNGTVTTGAFKNDALWQAEKELTVTVGQMEQSDDGTLFVKQTLDLTIHAKSDANWAGRIVCGRMMMSCLKSCQFDGFLRANEAEILLPYCGESRMTASGQWDVLAGPLTLKGNSSFYPSQPRKRHAYPAFVLTGKLSAAALISPFLAVELAADAIVRLAGISSMSPEADFNILVSAGALTTGKGSAIISLSKGARAEGIVCGATWYHEGQIRFVAEEVSIFTNSWIHNGRVTNMEGKQNHVKCCSVVVEELLLNRGTIATDSLHINGEGVLDNRGRIFAVHNMDIQLSNFHNEEGLMESKNSMRLLSATKEWTRLAGSIKAKQTIDLCAHKLDFAVKDMSSLCREDRLSFSARSDLVISTAIVEESRRRELGCAAQNSVTIDAPVEVDRLEVLLGGSALSDSATLMLGEKGDVIVSQLTVNGSAKELRLVLDGSLRCQKMSIAAGFETVVVSGKGQIQIASVQAEGSHLVFDLYQLISSDNVVARSITVQQDSLLRIQPCAENDTTSMSCASLRVEGTMFVERRLFIAAAKTGDLLISGPLIGSSNNSEISIEATRSKISGQMANFKYIELYAKEACNMQSIKIKNIARMTVDCGDLRFAGDFDACGNCVIHCDVAHLEGSCRSMTGHSTLELFATTVNSNMAFENMEKVSIGCHRSGTISGSFNRIRHIDIDCKWVCCLSTLTDCVLLTVSAWSMQMKGKIQADDVRLTSLGVVLLQEEVSASTLRIVVPFVLSLQYPLPASTELHSLVLISKHSPAVPKGVAYLSLLFDEDPLSTRISQSESNSWKDTSAMLKERFSGASVDVDEMLLGLKYISDLTPTRIRLDRNSHLYRELEKLIDKFSVSPISLFSSAELVAMVTAGRNQYTVTASQEKSNGGKKSKKREECLLYESLAQFRSAKYEREVRGSADTDGGYASRSSSEDLEMRSEGSPRSVRSPVSAASPMFDEGHQEKIGRRLDDRTVMQTTMEEINASLVEDEELAEFEDLEREIEDAERGIVRTDFVLCREKRIKLARLKQKVSSSLSPRPRPNYPLQRVPSSNDLVMKRFKVKNTLSSMDLRSFGSESSLASLDFGQQSDIGSPMQFPTSPFQRSLIPRGSFRSPRKVPFK